MNGQGDQSMPMGPPTEKPIGGPPFGMPMDGRTAEGAPAGGPPQSMPAGPPAGADPITGVMNMGMFGQAFAELMTDCPDHAALWYVDIRSFRSVNPKYGYEKGNAVLNSLARGLRAYLVHDLPITRLGGDRFVFVSAGLTLEDANSAFLEMADSVNAEVAQEGIGHRVVLVGGIYYLRAADLERRDFKRALDYASIAHRKAKEDSQGALVEFTDEDLERDTRRIIIEQSIERALEEGQIEVWYQPQVDYTYGEIIGAEALARWKHPELGLISPVEFIPVLEECGKVHDLDLYVWEEACRNAGRWRSAADGKPVPISVNVSRAEMFEADLLEHFMELRAKYSLPHGSLHLEITESAFAEGTQRLYDIIERMRASDMMVEMDDFGSGLSSLNMLKDVPVDVVKLDMGFVRSGVNEDRGGVVLGAVIRMLQGLDTPIIAEGVETLEQAEMLKNMGCHLMQGFHFSHPMPLDEFERFIGSNTTLERADRRNRAVSHLEDLLSFDKSSSYLFNEAIGGMMFFFVNGYKSESILVNDQFYEACGLKRSDFGNRKINPIDEIDEETRETLWRAAAEAREFGSAMCIAKVRLTGRWFQACMRYLGDSPRGAIFSLNICRSGELVEQERESIGNLQDHEWTLDIIDKIVPNGFVKCRADENLTIDYITPDLVAKLGHDHDKIGRRFHNSLIDLVAVGDRATMIEATSEALLAGKSFDCEVSLYGDGGTLVRAAIIGRGDVDATDKRALYMLVMLKGEAEQGEGDESLLFDRTVSFDYVMGEDKLVIYANLPDGSVREYVVDNWVRDIDLNPNKIDSVSAVKVRALVRDLRHHPLTGFTDLKCNLRGGEGLRWYHINYTCESDADGNTTVLHGYAQDANDEIGSVKWWRNQAERCHLTGLLNRNAVEQKINLLMHRHKGGIMFMIDLDGFKRVNDDLGHMVGDDLLRQVGTVLTRCFRESDALGRYGGDEFVALVPAPTTGDLSELARQRADEVIKAISEIEIPDGTHAACSVGAVVCQTSASFYDLLEKADKVLYESKTSGKGRATIATM